MIDLQVYNPVWSYFLFFLLNYLELDQHNLWKQIMFNTNFLYIFLGFFKNIIWFIGMILINFISFLINTSPSYKYSFLITSYIIFQLFPVDELLSLFWRMSLTCPSEITIASSTRTVSYVYSYSTTSLFYVFFKTINFYTFTFFSSGRLFALCSSFL